ncbi:Ribosome maturation factor RimM [Candidatus Nitrotoga sp. HW29]|uniref:ribosome maturation factor RimM n=1 Tax=Candidatus Nitrotoga sp. HW29 TaxID=2886963 RepID=UPI001EF1B98B|nr:ribosome maturation factor RimM [Candidatus Nitrotoga sp. HW29]CAH1905153.1 Ribosome maturation factor RimM [Candidatus Nitrotoga sp. HW29]
MPSPSWSSVLVPQQKHNQLDPMVVMGRVAGAQGILGWVKVKTYTESVDGLADYPIWWLGDEKHPWCEISVEAFAVHSKGLVAKFSDSNDRTIAEKYKGLLVAVPRSSLPQQPEDEYYWSDLIGLTVVDLAGKCLGVVDNLMDTGANQVLCVQEGSSKKNRGELLIPFIASAIQQVDLTEKVIRVDWAVDWAAKR